MLAYLSELNTYSYLIFFISILYLIRKKISKDKIKYEETSISYKTYVTSLPDDNNKTFLVMSYNILADFNTKQQYYPYCSEKYLDIKYRAPRILAEIEQVNPDILCLQECDVKLLSEFYSPNLEVMGYSSKYKPNSCNQNVINAICFKNSKFSFENQYNIDLNEDLIIKDEAFKRFKDAIILNLTHNLTQKKIVIVNTQLFWNPEYEFVRYGQISKILKYIERKYSKIPFILCGDLNCEPNSNILRYIYGENPDLENIKYGDVEKNKKLIKEIWLENIHNLKLSSAYECYKLDRIIEQPDYSRNHPEFTHLTHKFRTMLDYLIYCRESFDVTQVLEVPINDKEVIASRLPNRVYPSDHLKIAARFKII